MRKRCSRRTARDVRKPPLISAENKRDVLSLVDARNWNAHFKKIC